MRLRWVKGQGCGWKKQAWHSGLHGTRAGSHSHLLPASLSIRIHSMGTKKARKGVTKPDAPMPAARGPAYQFCGPATAKEMQPQKKKEAPFATCPPGTSLCLDLDLGGQSGLLLHSSPGISPSSVGSIFPSDRSLNLTLRNHQSHQKTITWAT